MGWVLPRSAHQLTVDASAGPLGPVGGGADGGARVAGSCLLCLGSRVPPSLPAAQASRARSPTANLTFGGSPSRIQSIPLAWWGISWQAPVRAVTYTGPSRVSTACPPAGSACGARKARHASRRSHPVRPVNQAPRTQPPGAGNLAPSNLQFARPRAREPCPLSLTRSRLLTPPPLLIIRRLSPPYAT